MRHLLLAALLLSAPALAEQQKLSFEIQRADLHGVLRVLAESMKVNLVVAENVKGAVTLRLRNVTPQQAFEVVLQSYGLGVEKKANIWRVAPLTQLTSEAEQRARLKEAKHKSAELETRLVPVSYANAADLVPHVKAMLTDRGSVAVDARTNTLIIRDVKE
jgi:type II secretory pathway component HofQ